MSNLFKYVENFFGDYKNTTPGIQNNASQSNSIRNNNRANSHTGTSKALNTKTTNKSILSSNNNNVTNDQGYISNYNNNQNNSNFEYYKRRKEIKENLNEESQIKIFGENQNFSMDLKVFGRSIFQNLILTATATVKNNYRTNGVTQESIIIPIKCVWKRFKNETEISISNINTNSYIPTAEDIGYTILVEAFPVDKNLYGDSPLFAQYGPIEMDLNIKSTLELLLTSGGTKFSCFFYDNIEQEKKTDKEIILHINSNELRLCEVDYNGKEIDLEKTRLHHLNPQIFLNTKDTQRFLLRFFKFEKAGKKKNVNSKKCENPENGGDENQDFTNLTQEIKREYDLIAMSKQCRELIYLLIQIFLIDEKIKNSKLFTCANYNLLPQETKIGVTDLITEIKTLREENIVIINNMKYYESLNSNLRKEMKDLEEEFQISLESINNSMRINSISNIENSKNSNKNSNDKNSNSDINLNKNNNAICNFCSNGRNSVGNLKDNCNLVSPNIPRGSTGNKYNIPNHNSSKNENGNFLDLKIKYDELKDVNLNLVSKEKALREENQDLLLKLEIGKNTNNDLTNEIKKLKVDFNQTNLDLKSLNKNSQILSEQKNKLQIKYDSLEKERDNLLDLKNILSLKVENLEKADNLQIKNQQELNEKKIEELNKKVETLNYEIKNLIIQRNLLTNQKENLTKEFEKLKNEKARNDKEQSNLFQEIDNLKEIIKEKERVFITLNNEVENSKKICKEIKEKYEILDIEYSTLKENFDKNFLNYNNNINNNFGRDIKIESNDENSFNYNNKNFNDSIFYSNLPSQNNINDNRLHKITSEEFEELEMLRREKEESDALIMQLRSNGEAKDMEIANLKKLIDGLRGKK